MRVCILSLIFLGHVSCVKRCFECNDVPHPADCSVITFCADSEQCVVKQYISTGGQVLYGSGCESKQRCDNLGKRSVEDVRTMLDKHGADEEEERHLAERQSDILVCEQCCSADFCNVNGCGVQAPVLSQRGPFCLQCHEENDPVNCRHVAQCPRGEVCATYQIVDHNQAAGILYRSECIHELQCHSLQVVAKTHNRCYNCCNKDFCNDKCVL